MVWQVAPAKGVVVAPGREGAAAAAVRAADAAARAVGAARQVEDRSPLS